MSNLPTVQGTNQSIQALNTLSRDLKDFLSSFGLPNDNVLVPIQERASVINNIPSILNGIQNYDQSQAIYLSKMVAACTVGLFDAALNFLWDETIADLRKKVSLFDLQYFYATAVPDEKQRGHFTSEEDLKKLSDAQLIHACLEVGLIPDITYKHLDYIRDMRNFASAAHPNQNEITGLQLSFFIEICIKDVLAVAPDGSLVKIKSLLENIREQIFTIEIATSVCAAIQQLPNNRLPSLAKSIFGMFFDPSISSNTKNNILLLANSIWVALDEQSKHDIGLKYASFSANGDTIKAQSVRGLLQHVNGLSYLDENTKTIDIQNILERLLIAHDGFDNYHTEGPLAKTLCQFIPEDGIAPASILNNYVKTIAICFIGNSYGFSWEAQPLYEKLVSTWKDRETLILCSLLQDAALSSRLQFQKCFTLFISLLAKLKNQVSNIVLKDLVSYLETRDNKTLLNISTDSRYLSLLKSISL